MDWPILILTATFIVTIVLGWPIAFSMILSFIAYCLTSHTPLALLPIKLVGSLESFPLLAVPYFIMAASIMNKVGVTDKLFDFITALLGHIRGGLAHANILNNMIFSGISGSAVADACGPGLITIRAMIDRGYSREFSAATTAAASVMGPIIPPSIGMVIYAVMTGEPVKRLFAGGIIPGILMGIAMMIYIAIAGKKKNLPKEPRADLKTLAKTFVKAILPLFAPIIIVGSILTGMATPTEGGAIAVFYSLLLGALYRTIRVKDLVDCLRDTVLFSSVCLFLLAASSSYAWAITIKKLPELVYTFMIGVTDSPTMAMIIVMALLTFLGCIMSADAGLIITVPVLLKIAEGYHIDLIYMGVVSVVVLSIGVITPPVGVSLYVITAMVKTPFEAVAKACLPYLIPQYVIVFLVIFFPVLVMFIPNLIR
jgi:tripartite ATP-independent transporter DctM subunit